MKARLKKIEARCKALGWDCEINHYKDRAGDCIRVELRDTSGGWLELHGSLAPSTAEALLERYEPGDMVTVKENPLYPGSVVNLAPGTYRFTKVVK